MSEKPPIRLSENEIVFGRPAPLVSRFTRKVVALGVVSYLLYLLERYVIERADATTVALAILAPVSGYVIYETAGLRGFRLWVSRSQDPAGLGKYEAAAAQPSSPAPYDPSLSPPPSSQNGEEQSS